MLPTVSNFATNYLLQITVANSYALKLYGTNALEALPSTLELLFFHMKNGSTFFSSSENG